MPARKKKNKIDAGDVIGNTQAVTTPINVMTAYKGFDNEFKCRGLQYQVGHTYKHDGEFDMCYAGFHACEKPLDVQNYYPIWKDSRYAIVTLRGVSDETSLVDSKRVSAEITIEREITFSELIEAEVDYLVRKGEAASSGENSTVASAGERSRAGCSGYSSIAATAGPHSTAASAGFASNAASVGDYSKALSAGGSSIAAAAGDSSIASSVGDSSLSASAGSSSKAASSGEYSIAVSAGYLSEAASSGEYSTAVSAGHYSKASCGSNGFACVAGLNGAVKGKDGSALALGYRDEDGRPRIKVLYVGEDGIEPDTWYHCNAGGVPFKVQ